FEPLELTRRRSNPTCPNDDTTRHPKEYGTRADARAPDDVAIARLSRAQARPQVGGPRVDGRGELSHSDPRARIRVGMSVIAAARPRPSPEHECGSTVGGV